MTDAMAAGRFPVDEPLNTLGHRQAESADDVSGRTLCGPERRTRQTAELLGAQPIEESALSDLDVGRWRGMPLGGVAPDELAEWMSDPSSAPHDGESVVDVVGRVRDWLHTLTAGPDRIIAVTHPAVIRSAILVALDAPPKSFWRMDIEPVSRTVLHHRGAGWTLRSKG